jgi:hypothetical protein
VNNWHKVSFATTTTALTLNGGSSPLTIVHGTSVSVKTTVTGTPGIPTGDVAVVTNVSANLIPNNGGLGFLTLDSTGATSGTINSFPGGTYQVISKYSGDATFSASVSTPPITLTVTPEDSVTNFAMFANGASIPVSGGNYAYGTVITAIVQPAGKRAG